MASTEELYIKLIHAGNLLNHNESNTSSTFSLVSLDSALSINEIVTHLCHNNNSNMNSKCAHWLPSLLGPLLPHLLKLSSPAQVQQFEEYVRHVLTDHPSHSEGFVAILQYVLLRSPSPIYLCPLVQLGLRRCGRGRGCITPLVTYCQMCVETPTDGMLQLLKECDVPGYLLWDVLYCAGGHVFEDLYDLLISSLRGGHDESEVLLSVLGALRYISHCRSSSGDGQSPEGSDAFLCEIAQNAVNNNPIVEMLTHFFGLYCETNTSTVELLANSMIYYIVDRYHPQQSEIVNPQVLLMLWKYIPTEACEATLSAILQSLEINFMDHYGMATVPEHIRNMLRSIATHSH
eukprot:PhF_6_TR37798/c0_g1_i1/m.56278